MTPTPRRTPFGPHRSAVWTCLGYPSQPSDIRVVGAQCDGRGVWEQDAAHGKGRGADTRSGGGGNSLVGKSGNYSISELIGINLLLLQVRKLRHATS